MERIDEAAFIEHDPQRTCDKNGNRMRILLANGVTMNKSMKITNGNIKEHSTIKVAFWNINRGYLSKGKIHEVEEQMKNLKLDICALAEVDIFNTSFHMDSLYDIEGYTFELPKSWKKEGRARTILYMKKHLTQHIKIRKDLMTDNQTDIWLEIKVPGERKLVVGAYYREFTGLDGDNTMKGQKERFAQWLQSVNKVEEEGKEVLIVGDFNFEAGKLNKEDGSSLAGLMTKCCNENGLDQLVKGVTRSRVMKDRIEESSIDHIYSNNKEKVRKIKVMELTTSDHRLIKCERMTNTGITPEKVTVRSYKRFDEDKFRKDLADQDWEKFWEEEDLNNATELFTKIIVDTLDKHAPMISFIPKEKYKSWISTETKLKMKERDIAFRESKRSRKEADISNWKRLRNQVVGLLKRDNKEKFETSFKTNDAWRLIKQVDNKAESGGPPQKLRIDGKVVKDKKELAQHLNKHFVQKIEKSVADIEKTEAEFCPVEHFKKHIQQPEANFEFHEVDTKETETIIDSLKNTTGSGVDNLSNKILKIAKPEISKQLTRIINQIIKTGEYPRCWKKCVLIPLLKRKDPLEAKNYRPIHLLPKSSLVCEQVLLNQMSDHWKRWNLTSKSQHGYTRGRSCVTALTELYDNWVRHVDRGAYSGIYLSDMSSAFELVEPAILDSKLEALKVKELARKLISNYLTNREQTTKIDNRFSDKAVRSIGVAPGSKIGPFLFSTYVMDLPETTEGDTVCYSDDTTCSVHNKDPNKVVEMLEEDAKAITDYMRSNRLCLAEGKSSFLLAHNKQKVRSMETENLVLKLGEEVIKQARTATILGLKINNNLDWNDFLFGDDEDKEYEGLIKKLKKRLGMARKVSNLPFKLRKMVLTGIFMGKLGYALEIYGSANKGQIQQIQQLQNRAARMVTKNPRSVSTRECINQCGWLRIETLIKQKILWMGYNIRLNQTVPYIDKHIGRSRKTMSSTITSYDPEYGKLFRESTLPTFVRLWNQLPQTIREASPKEFKVKMTAHIKQEERKAEETENDEMVNN